MYLHNRLENRNNFFQKIKDIDFILLIGILLLGFISVSTMYSTDGGQILFHTKSHFIKFVVFTGLMLVISFSFKLGKTILQLFLAGLLFQQNRFKILVMFYIKLL